MLKISLDTNAVLDFCYRAYPQHIFDDLWRQLLAQKSASFVKFYVCQSVIDELNQKITDYEYDVEKFNTFMGLFNVEIIQPAVHGESTLHLKRQLLNFPVSRNSRHVNTDNYADLDIISLAHSWQGDICVLTCEQKSPMFNWQNQSQERAMKVPNICEQFSIECGNWVLVLEKLGIQNN